MRATHATRARLFMALTLVAGLFPVGGSKPVEAICPLPPAAMPTGCCREAVPPACPSCPSESRSSCPTRQPSGASSHGTVAALPPDDPTRETRESVSGETATAAPPTAAAAPVRSRAISRRTTVTGVSPPARLLNCISRT